MAGRFLLDTNAVIAFLADDDAVSRAIVDADEVFVSATVLGELYYGAAKSTRVDENVAVVDRFARSCGLLLCTGTTARTYGYLKAALKSKGTPIPENDIWIAAVAVDGPTVWLWDRLEHRVRVTSCLLDHPPTQTLEELGAAHQASEVSRLTGEVRQLVARLPGDHLLSHGRRARELVDVPERMLSDGVPAVDVIEFAQAMIEKLKSGLSKKEAGRCPAQFAW